MRPTLCHVRSKGLGGEEVRAARAVFKKGEGRFPCPIPTRLEYAAQAVKDASRRSFAPSVNGGDKIRPLGRAEITMRSSRGKVRHLGEFLK